MNTDCEKTPTFKYLKYLQRFIIIILLFIMSLILLLAIFDLGFFIFKNIFQGEFGQFSFTSLNELFSMFLVILIGVELLEAVKAFLQKEIIHVEIVVLVAIIAIARKVIIWDFSNVNSWETISLAAMLLSLAITYALIKGTELRVNLFGKRGKLKKTEFVSPEPENQNPSK